MKRALLLALLLVAGSSASAKDPDAKFRRRGYGETSGLLITHSEKAVMGREIWIDYHCVDTLREQLTRSLDERGADAATRTAELAAVPAGGRFDVHFSAYQEHNANPVTYNFSLVLPNDSVVWDMDGQDQPPTKVKGGWSNVVSVPVPMAFEPPIAFYVISEFGTADKFKLNPKR